MGFTLRFMLGFFLVSAVCYSYGKASPWRHTRTIRSEKPSAETLSSQPSLTEAPPNNGTTPTIVRNDNSNEKNVETKPKTETSTENYLNKDKLTKPAIKDVKKLAEFDDSKKKKEIFGENSPTVRTDGGRSLNLNVDKYVSADFHNKNNVYTLPSSPDTEKYENLHPEYEEVTQSADTEKYYSVDTSSELTTPSTKLFDNEYRKVEEGSKQNLEYVDHQSKDIEYKPSERIEISKNNDSNSTSNYIKYRNYNHGNDDKGVYNQESSFEKGEVVNYSTNYSKTVDDSHPKDYKNKIPVVDVHSSDSKLSYKIVKSTLNSTETTTQKPLLKPPTSLTKRPNRTESRTSLLNNKIESEIVKTTISNLAKWTSTTASPFNIDPIKSSQESITRKSPASVMKRGSTKFLDTIKYTTVSSTYAEKVPTVKSSKYKTHLASKENKTSEQEVLENQVAPFHIPHIEANFHTENTTTEKPILTTLENVIRVTPIVIKPDLSNESIETTTISEVPSTNSVPFTTTPNIEVEITTKESSTIPTTIASDDITTDETPTTTKLVETTEFPIVTTTNEVTSTTSTNEDITTIFPTDYYKTTTFSSVMNSRTEADNRENQGRELYPHSGELNPNVSEIHVEDHTSNTLDVNTLTTIVTVVKTIDKNESTTMSPVLIKTTSESLVNVIIKDVTEEPFHEVFGKENVTDPECEEDDGCGDSDYHDVTNKTVEMQGEIDDIQPKLTPRKRPTTSSDISNETSAEVTTTMEVMQFENPKEENNSGTIAAITISCIGAICLVLLAGLLYIIKKRHKHFNYGQRCRPVSLDAYSVDNVSVYNSMRRKGAMRASKRSYGNPAFDDSDHINHPLNFPALAKFATNLAGINSEFDEVPQITAQMNELPEGCDTKNRYANVIPLPETRVHLISSEEVPNSDYINANYVTGPKDTKKYYIATQAPLQNTVDDFWKMIWEQQSKVILMLTHHYENGVEKCVDYLPPSEVLDCHRLFGDFQITLKKREVKEKYVISSLQLKNMVSNSWREITHLWYMGWPEKGVPTEANSLIAFLIEARSYVKMPASSTENGKGCENNATGLQNSPIIVHCSPGTGRTGTVIACDIAIREFELTRQVDIPKTVYRIRRERASSVQTKEQYAFIYKVISLYATKLTGEALDGF